MTAVELNPGKRRAPRVAPKALQARRAATPLRVEGLEPRRLMTALGPQGQAGGPVNDTLDRAADLGTFGEPAGTSARGAIGHGPGGAAEVDWYRFTLDRPAVVSATLGGTGDDDAEPDAPEFRGVLGLFHRDTDFVDLTNPLGPRLLQRAQGEAEQPAELGRLLGPGTYYLAVSGAGNLDFHPLLAGSGLPGAEGDYELSLGIAEAEGVPGAGDGPVVLTSDPAPGAVLDASPLVIRLGLSGPVDPFSLFPDVTVLLTSSPDPTFGDDNDLPVALLAASASLSVGEVQLVPASPLGPGFYRVTLIGDASTTYFGVTTPDFIPLGMDADHPLGRDFSLTFEVAGIEGHPGPDPAVDDTAETFRDLGELASGVPARAVGAIGDDPTFDPFTHPGNDVDLYRFRIVQPGRYAFRAEAFAGRIGSALDAGLSVYRLDPETGTLRLIAGNNNSYNPVATAGGELPLFTDPALDAPLEAGEYYIAVSSGTNTPSPLEGTPEGSPGVFDPNLSHSGQAGFSTGDYVLSLIVEAIDDPPRVLSASVAEGQVLARAPSVLVVEFDRPVNLPLLAFQAHQVSDDRPLAAVSVVSASGATYYPRYVSYDHATNRATFLMLDGLPTGDYELRLSGAEGLSDLAGNPLLGNDPGGDHVVRFSVSGPARGVAGDPLRWANEPSFDDVEHPQEIGVLFPRELEAGVAFIRQEVSDPDGFAPDAADVYRFEVLSELKRYTISITGDELPEDIRLELRDASGAPVPDVIASDDGRNLVVFLEPGVYLLTATGWGEDESAGLAYQINLTFTTSLNNAPPLFSAPVPATAIRLDSAMPPPVTPPPVDPPPVIPPPTPTPTPIPTPTPVPTPPAPTPTPTPPPPAPSPMPIPTTPAPTPPVGGSPIPTSPTPAPPPPPSATPIQPTSPPPSASTPEPPASTPTPSPVLPPPPSSGGGAQAPAGGGTSVAGPAPSPLPPNFSIDVPSTPASPSEPGGHQGVAPTSTDLTALAFQPIGAEGSQDRLDPETRVAAGEPLTPNANPPGPGLGQSVNPDKHPGAVASDAPASRRGDGLDRGRLAVELATLVQLGPGEADAGDPEGVEGGGAAGAADQGAPVAGPGAGSSPLGPDRPGASDARPPADRDADQVTPPEGSAPEEAEAMEAVGPADEPLVDEPAAAGPWRWLLAAATATAGALGCVLARRRLRVRRAAQARIAPRRDDGGPADEHPDGIGSGPGRSHPRDRGWAEAGGLRDRTTSMRPKTRGESAMVTMAIRPTGPSPAGGGSR